MNKNLRKNIAKIAIGVTTAALGTIVTNAVGGYLSSSGPSGVTAAHASDASESGSTAPGEVAEGEHVFARKHPGIMVHCVDHADPYGRDLRERDFSPLCGASWAGRENGQWVARRDGAGSDLIKNVRSGKCVTDVTSRPGSSGSGSMEKCSGRLDQKWAAVRKGRDIYFVRRPDNSWPPPGATRHDAPNPARTGKN